MYGWWAVSVGSSAILYIQTRPRIATYRTAKDGMTLVEEITNWPDRLHSALEVSSCPYDDLIERLDLPPDGGWLRAALDGRLRPTVSNLVELSACCNIPLATLTSNTPQQGSLEMALRAKLEVIHGDTEDISRRAQTLLADLRLLLVWSPDIRAAANKALSDARRVATAGSYALGAARSTARRLRDILDLGDEPIVDLVPIIENLGVPVLLEKLPASLQGLTITDTADSQRACMVFVNSNDWWGRQRFTLAHELCHLIYADPGSVFVEKSNFDTDNQIEYRCEAFARYFLAPPNAVRAFWDEHKPVRSTDGLAKPLALFMMTFGTTREAALNIFNDDLEIADDQLAPYRQIPNFQLMRSAGLGQEWATASSFEGTPSTSDWLLDLALKAYEAKFVGAPVVASVLGRSDVECVESELREAGWGNSQP